MQAREKQLGIGFIVICTVAVVLKFVYPGLIRPMFDYGDRLARVTDELEELGAEQDQLERELQDKYRDYVLRSGSTDPSVTKDELFYGISGLLHKAKLKGANVSPKTESIDRKSRVATLRISVSARGTFAQCIDFVRAFYKMPYIARLNSLKLDPTHARQQAQHDEVQLDAEIEARVLPSAEAWGEPTGKQPEEVDLVLTQNLHPLRQWKPFSPYIQPTRKPTPTPTVTVKPTPPPPPPPPPPPQCPEWANADELALRMVTRTGSDEYRMEEAVLENLMDSSTRYVSVGEELDGGELVLLHAMGAVAHKASEDEDFGYWVYPIGEMLNARLRLNDAVREWPEIYIAARQYVKALDAATQAQSDAAAKAEQLAAPDAVMAAADSGTSGMIDTIATDGVLVGSNGVAPSNLTTSGAALTQSPQPTSAKTSTKSQRGGGKTVQDAAERAKQKASPKMNTARSKGARSADRPKTKKRSSAKRTKTRVPRVGAIKKPADTSKETDDVAPPE